MPLTLILLLLPPLDTSIHLLLAPISLLIETLNHEEVGLMEDILRVDGIPSAFAEREVIDGIQQIGLSHAVLPQETVQLIGKEQIHLLQIPVIEYRNSF